METEIWKKNPEIEKLEVSTFGRVRTLDKVVPSGKYTRFIKGRVLKQFDNSKGYLQVNIKVDGKWTRKTVHRIVAQTFLPNPNSFPMVNHRDCDRTNNNVDNLEWCTAKYNSQYQEKYGKAKSKPVLALNLATLEVSKFKSQSEAGQALGANVGNINSVIKGRIKQTSGFWFVNDDDKATDAINNKLHKIRKGW
jgi:hypothetical protein